MKMNSAPPLITDRRRKLEIAAVVLTGTGKFVFMDLLNWRLPFIAVAILGWAAYVVFRSRQHPGILAYWGFRTDTFQKVLKMILPFGLIAVVACVTVGYFLGTLHLTWHIFPILLLYPVWGVIQQFLVIGLVAGNLQDLTSIRWSNSVIIVITALLFGLIHYPYGWLMLGTFVLALLYGFIYLKARNVYVMGLFHGWLGAIFFYTVVGRDPFAEIMKGLIN